MAAAMVAQLRENCDPPHRTRTSGAVTRWKPPASAARIIQSKSSP